MLKNLIQRFIDEGEIDVSNVEKASSNEVTVTIERGRNILVPNGDGLWKLVRLEDAPKTFKPPTRRRRNRKNKKELKR